MKIIIVKYNFQTIQNTNIGGTISSISQTPLTHGTSTNFYNGSSKNPPIPKDSKPVKYK